MPLLTQAFPSAYNTLFHPCFLLLHLLISTSDPSSVQMPPPLGCLPRPKKEQVLLRAPPVPRVTWDIASLSVSNRPFTVELSQETRSNSKAETPFPTCIPLPWHRVYHIKRTHWMFNEQKNKEDHRFYENLFLGPFCTVPVPNDCSIIT